MANLILGANGVKSHQTKSKRGLEPLPTVNEALAVEMNVVLTCSSFTQMDASREIMPCCGVRLAYPVQKQCQSFLVCHLLDEADISWVIEFIVICWGKSIYLNIYRANR